MGRRPCYSKVEDVNREAWTANEDLVLTNYIHTHGETGWRSLSKKAGLNRSGKSCRLRWLNYLRPDIKRGNISGDEEEIIIRMHRLLGNRWALIAGRLPGRTDNEIKNYWNSHLSKTIAMSNGTAINSTSHVQLRKSESLSSMKERNPSSQNSSEDDAVKPFEIRWASNTELSSGVLAVTEKSVGGKEEAALDVSKSWAQLLEDSFVGEEDSRVDERNTILSSQLNVPYPLEFFDPFSLLCIDFGLFEDFSVECLLQPEPHGVEDMRPFENAHNNVNHADCLAMATEQETAYTLQQRQQCGEQTMQIELDHLFYYEESWEDQVPLSGLSKTNEEEYLDILVYIPN